MTFRIARTDYEFQKRFWESEKKRRKPWHPAIEAFTKPKLAYINGEHKVDSIKQGAHGRKEIQ
jgi:hypothetical protein